MSRYIDADALREEWLYENGTFEPNDVLDSIDCQPTIAAVPVVRCGECKYRFMDGENVRFNVCELNHNKVQADDWFCADGERKDGETEQCNTYSLGKIEMPKGAIEQIIADGERKEGAE